MKKVMTKDEAKKAAEAKCLDFAHQGTFSRIRRCDDRYEVDHPNVTFPPRKFFFIVPKDGDVCLARHRDGDTGTVFFNEERLWFYWDGKCFNHECSWTLIKTTGFNVLEDMK